MGTEEYEPGSLAEFSSESLKQGVLPVGCNATDHEGVRS
jgi:hypothetical protein